MSWIRTNGRLVRVAADHPIVWIRRNEELIEAAMMCGPLDWIKRNRELLIAAHAGDVKALIALKESLGRYMVMHRTD